MAENSETIPLEPPSSCPTTKSESMWSKTPLVQVGVGQSYNNSPFLSLCAKGDLEPRGRSTFRTLSFQPFKRGEFEMCLHVGKGRKKTDNSSYFTYITSFNMMSVFTHEVIEA